MKKIPIIFLKAVVTLAAVVAIALLIIEPQREGVNAHATILQIYSDPFTLFVYLGSIPFFVTLYQIIKLLGYSGRNEVFSPKAIKAIQNIKYCALTIIGFIVAEEILIMFTHGNDDATGAFMMGVFIILGSLVVVAAAKLFEQILLQGIEIKKASR